MSGSNGARGAMRASGGGEEWRPDPGHGFGEVGKALLIALAAVAAVVVPGGWIVYAGYAERESARIAASERLGAYDRLIAAAPLEMLPVGATAHGRDLFLSACAACHSAAGTGVPGLGKDLTTSWFVAALDDGELARFLAEGREANAPDNTTRMPMPPRGGRTDLSDADLGDIVL